MFERFTKGCIKVILLAQEEARRLGHNYVGTEFILLGLIGEGDGIAAKTLMSMGVTIRNARIEVEKILGRGSGITAVEIPFAQSAKHSLQLSWQAARDLDHNYVATEHLLLGLISEGRSDSESSGNAVKVLDNLGIDIERLNTETKEAAKGAAK